MDRRLPAILCGAVLSLADVAVAQDKSGYTLFDPTPSDEMRGFSTDRPNKSSSPYTVDAGHWQVESDLFNYFKDSGNGVSVRQITTIAPVVKLGLTNRSDVEMVVPTHAWVRTESGGKTSTARGWTDLTLRLKVNLYGNDDGDSALAVVPYVKFPTGSAGISNKAYEYGVYAPLGVKLSDSWSVIFLAQADSQVSSVDTHARRLNLQGLANFSFAASETVTLSAEYYAQRKFRDNAATVQTADFAVSWVVGDDLQLDAAWYVPLNKAAPNLNVYFGISKRW